MNTFVRYVAQYPAIAPQVVLRRLKYMGTFFLIGVIGSVAALALIGLDVSMSEPARLLTVFGFVAATVVIVATVFSAGLLLWGGFISQYVANLDSKAEVTQMFEEGVPGPVSVEVGDLRMKLAAVEAAFRRIEAMMPAAEREEIQRVLDKRLAEFHKE